MDTPTAAKAARGVPRLELGRRTPDADEMQVVGDAPLLAELRQLVELMRREPNEVLVGYLSQVRTVMRMLAVEGRRDTALLQAMAPDDVPTPAKVLQLRRNASARSALIEEFGLYTTSELAELRQAETENASSVPTRWLRERRIFDVPPIGDRRFPGYQFDDSGRPIDVMRDLIAVLQPILQGWELALWFTAPNSTLDGRRPADLLVTEPDRVGMAAAFEANTTESW